MEREMTMMRAERRPSVDNRIVSCRIIVHSVEVRRLVERVRRCLRPSEEVRD